MITKIIKYYAAVLLVSLLFPVIADARIEYTLFPRLSIEGRYSDNYYNEEEKRNDAYTVIISPGILLSIMTQDIILDLNYDLNITGYFIEKEDSDEYENRYEYFNQRGSAAFRANLSRNMSILLRDEIIKNTDISLIDENLTRRERRSEFIRNAAGGDLIYRYAEGSEVSVGYLFTIVEYLDTDADDSERHDLTGRISHSFNIRNIGYLNYRHSIVDYKWVGGTGGVSREDIYEDEIRPRFIHYLTPMFSVGLNYGYLETHYDRATPDYHIHDAALESVYNISRYLTADGRFGMYFREQYNRENRWEEGLIYRARLTYTYPTFTGSAAYEGGYDSNYINPERLQYYDYWRLSGDMTYHLIRDFLMLSGHGYYRFNIYPNLLETRRDYIWNAGGGISYRAADWFLFSLEYNHTERDSNLPGLHYVENTYLARITISYRYSTIERERVLRREGERDNRDGRETERGIGEERNAE